jgi:hypothetical protein
MVALREIEAGEVLAWDYQSTEEDLVAFEADFSCQCGSAKCKGHIKGYAHELGSAQQDAPLCLPALVKDDSGDETTQASSPHSVQACLMSTHEYAALEQSKIEQWAITVHDSEKVGKFIAPGCRVPEGEVVMVLPPYNIQRWHEVVDNDMVIQVRGGGKEKALFSCANSRDTMDCYLNHSCEPNLKAVVLGDYAVHMVALREIEAGEVLAWDYQSTEEDLVAFEADFSCQCGSAKCKGHIKGYSH